MDGWINRQGQGSSLQRNFPLSLSLSLSFSVCVCVCPWLLFVAVWFGFFSDSSLVFSLGFNGNAFVALAQAVSPRGELGFLFERAQQQHKASAFSLSLSLCFFFPWLCLSSTVNMDSGGGWWRRLQ